MTAHSHETFDESVSSSAESCLPSLRLESHQSATDESRAYLRQHLSTTSAGRPEGSRANVRKSARLHACAVANRAQLAASIPVRPAQAAQFGTA